MVVNVFDYILNNSCENKIDFRIGIIGRMIVINILVRNSLGWLCSNDFRFLANGRFFK